MDILLITLGIYLAIGVLLAFVCSFGVKQNRIKMFFSIVTLWLPALIFNYLNKK